MINKLISYNNFKLLLNVNSKLPIQIGHQINECAKASRSSKCLADILFINLSKYHNRPPSNANKNVNSIKSFSCSNKPSTQTQRYQFRSNNAHHSNDNRILIKRIYNTESTKPGANESLGSTSTSTQAQSLSIFKRFKEAYKQHGKVLIYCHIVLCCGWIVGFYFLSN